MQNNSAAEDQIPISCIDANAQTDETLCLLKLRDLARLLSTFARLEYYQCGANELDAEICRLMTERQRLASFETRDEVDTALATILTELNASQ